MTRLKQLPEVQFAEDFKELRRDIEAIKNAQRVGKDILKPKIIEVLDAGEPTVFDLHTDNNDLKGFKAIFVADHQQEPWATPFYKVTIGTIDGEPVANDIAGFSYLDFDELAPGQIGYIGHFGANAFMDNRDVWLKVYFYATDTGTLTVTEEPL